MKILATTFAFNEGPYYPAWVDYYRNQGCEIFIMDNYSSDESETWLRENKIPCKKVNTNETFNLLVLQQALVNEIRKINPDWVLYGGIDLYHIFPDGIKATLEDAGSGNFNIIETDHWEVHNTGEEVRIPLTKSYFYTRKIKRLRMISKYGRGFNLVADELFLDNSKVYPSSGITINYGMCKTREERELTYARRKKAWEQGMHKGWGTHYIQAKSDNWVWDKNTLTDIRTRPEIELIKQTW